MKKILNKSRSFGKKDEDLCVTLRLVINERYLKEKIRVEFIAEAARSSKVGNNPRTWRVMADIEIHVRNASVKCNLYNNKLATFA